LNKNYATIIAKRQEGGIFKFSFYTSNISYVFIDKLLPGDPLDGHSNRDYTILPFYFIEKGDHIKIKLAKQQNFSRREAPRGLYFQFSGKGSSKFMVKYGADSASYYDPDTTAVLTIDKLYNNTNFEASHIKAGLKFIEKNKRLLSKSAYELLKLDFISERTVIEVKLLSGQLKRERINHDEAAKIKFLKSYTPQLYSGKEDIPINILSFSINYTEGLLATERFKELLVGDTSTANLYYLLKRKYQGDLLERIIVGYFYKYTYNISDFNHIYENAIKYVRSPLYLKYIMAYKNRLGGNLAYDFMLPDTNGKLVKLSNFKGKTVFIDFWYTGCAGCSHFYQDQLSKVEQEFKEDSTIVFITICIDKNKKQWIKSIHSGKYTSPDVLNLFTNGKGIDDDVIKFYNVREYPQPIIVTKDQKLLSFGGDEFFQMSTLRNKIKSLSQHN